jgi:carbon storage regulator
MLVLTRKKGESIVIGDDIEIIVADIQGDQVRLGINAPSNISIHRKEVFLEIQEENRKAAEVKMISLKDVLKNRDKEK